MFWLLVLPLIIIVGFSLGTIRAHMDDWLIYPEVYNTLKDRIFYQHQLEVYSHLPGHYDDGFTWYPKTKNIRLKYGVHMNKNFIEFLDPYYLYWWLKYTKWLNNHLKKDLIL